MIHFYLVPMFYVITIRLRNALVPKLQLGNPVEALGNCSRRCSTSATAPCAALPTASVQSSCIHAVAASRDGKLELPIPNSQAGAWELANSDIGRNKTARRQQGWAFPAIGMPETPVLRLMRGQAYSGLLRDVYNNECSAWERGRA
ncbi:MAG TPA: hypothetical protein VIF37_10690 [Methylobacter sp.]|jgi:hypothetical protein